MAAAPADEQLGLIRAHPELAGKAMVSKTLTAESTNEQGKAGLTDCTPEEFAKIQQLNADYNAKFGFPFILAVRGPRGTGLSQARDHRHLRAPAAQPSGLRARPRRCATSTASPRSGWTTSSASSPTLGNDVWDWQEQLAAHTDPGYAEKGQLTVTYLTDAHRACARADRAMACASAGFDTVEIDAVGNVVGRYEGATPGAKTLLTGSHYDTVRNGGKYDGRLGIFVPMACVRELKRQDRRLPFAFEVVGFAEEEGQRYKATFLGSGALIGHFDTELAGPEGRRRHHHARGACSTPA